MALSSTDVLASIPSAPSVKAAYWFPNEESSPVTDGGKKFSADLIDTSLFTHLYYSGAELNYVTCKVTVSSEFSKFSETVQKKNTELQMILSVRIKNPEDCTAFGLMINDPDYRKSFIEDSIVIARGLGFDGLDLDWEYPSNDVQMRC